MLRARLIGAEEGGVIEKWRQPGVGNLGWENYDRERQAAAQKDCSYLDDLTVASAGAGARAEKLRSTAAETLAAYGFIAPQVIEDAHHATWVMAHKPRSPSSVMIAIVEMRPGDVVSVSVAGSAHCGSAWAVLGRFFMEPMWRVTGEMEQQIKAKLHALTDRTGSWSPGAGKEIMGLGRIIGPTNKLSNTRIIDGDWDGIAAWDLGACESNSIKPPQCNVRLERTQDGWTLNVTGAPNNWALVQRSGNLKDWEDLGWGFLGMEGIVQVDDTDTGQGAMFYQVAGP